MLRDWKSHETYQKELRMHLAFFSVWDRGKVYRMEKSSLKLYHLNLDKSIPILNKLYPENKGCPAKNQDGILRSLILMLDQDRHSITNWALDVASDRFLCALCGFKYGEAPNYSSYYNFIDRLWLGSSDISLLYVRQLKAPYRKPSKKLKRNEKLPTQPRHSGAVKKFARLAEDDELPEFRYEMVLQELLARVVVDISAELGLLGNANALSLAGDGSAFYSGASHTGVKVCGCKSEGIFRCNCKRRYSDPDARWGWDSYRERYFYGDTLYALTATDSPNDLPVLLRKAQAPRHDSITTIFALSEARKLYPNMVIKDFVADGAMDNLPTYELCHHWNIRPFIPLDSRSVASIENLPSGIIGFDDQGRPLCHGGIPYENCGYSWPKGIKGRCYFAVKGLDAPCCCTPSSYGRTVYLKPEWDFRIFTPVPRSSPLFKQKLRDRTSVERTFKRIFEDYHVENGKCRSSKHRFMRATLAAINMHLDAWVDHYALTIDDLLAPNMLEPAV